VNSLLIQINARCAKCFSRLTVRDVNMEDGEACVDVDPCTVCRMDKDTEEMVGKRAAAKAHYMKLIDQIKIKDLELERDEINRSIGNLKRMQRPGDKMEQHEP